MAGRRLAQAACLLCALAVIGLASPAAAQPVKAPPDPLQPTDPVAMGFSKERLGRIREVLNREVAENRMPGAVLAIAREGKLVLLEAYGFRDKAAGVPMTTDTLFNIASMTKPMTTVAVLSLAEQGRLVLDEPVSTYLPGRFTDSKVAVLGASGNLESTVPASRPISIRDLLTHTSGLIYGGRGSTAVHKLYPAGSIAAANTLDGKALLDTLSAQPLMNQPGAVWDYGFGLDVAGLVVEALTGGSLDAALSGTVLKPLGMDDTGFVIPAAKAARYAKALPADPATGRPQAMDIDSTKPPRFSCGGGCAVSTATDYLRFALMLMNGGQFGGKRVLSPALTQYMLSNQLGPQVINRIGETDPTRTGYGFGLGLAVRATPGIARLIGSVGDFTWPGSSGTNWWGDPDKRLAVVFMAHTPGAMRLHYRYLINTLVYQALER